ncbi:MAG: exonuclease SbcCD subunit D [Acidaminococcus intestini]|nr:exonuclease SbcCD subunit D [Acidaminococcus intestini]
MRFLHTSDWHLGRIFHGLHLLEDQMAVLGELMSIIREEKIDALFIAGDIYDRSVPPTEAVRALDEILVQLVLGEKIPTVIIAGNHDNPDRLNFGRALFASENLFITGPASAKPKPVILSDKTGPIYVAPLPYCEPLTATELSGDKKTTHEAALSWQIAGILSAIPQKSRKIALSHTFVTGAQVTPDSERPLAAGGSSSVALSLYDAFHYTALGHLHAQQRLSDRAFYCGSLMKYSFSEVSQKKGVIIVDMDAAGNVTTTPLVLTPPHELSVLKGRFEDLLTHPRLEERENYLKIVLTDSTPVLDPKSRLEAVYPHILQLGYEGLSEEKKEDPARQRKNLTEVELFEHFFEAIQKRSMDDREQSLLAAVLDETRREGRNA